MRNVIILLFFLFISMSYSQDIKSILERISEAEPYTSQRFNYIMQIADAHRPFPKDEFVRDGMPKAYLGLANETLDWAKSQKDPLKIAQAQRFLFDYYCYEIDVEEATRLANQMIGTNNFASLQDKHFIYYKLSEIYKESGFIKEYIQIIPEMYKIGEQLNLDSSHMRNESYDIAMAYYSLKNYPKSRLYFKESLKAIEKENRPFALSSTYNNIGLTFSNEQVVDSALYYFQRSLDILQEAKAENEGFGNSDYDKHFKNVVEANIAYLDVYKKKYQNAIKAIEKELASARVVIDLSTEIQALQKLGLLHYKSGNYQDALNYITQAESKLSKNSGNRYRIGILDVKAKLYLAIGQQLKADKLFTEKEKLRDSIESVETKKTARVASVLYEVNKKDEEIAAQQSSIELLAAKNKIGRQLMIFGSVALVIFFIVILSLRSAKNARQREKLQEKYSQELINTQENERSRLALELHDGVGQQLTMLARKTKAKKDNSLTELALDTLENLRDISLNLHPNSIKQLGFSTTVENLVNQIDRDTNVFFTMYIEDVDEYMDQSTALHLYRLIQEVLTNIIKHSGAKSVEIDFRKHKNQLILQISDSGKGFNFEKKLQTSKGLGLYSIKERSKIINAKLSFNSSLDKGSLYKIVLPAKTLKI